MKKPLLGKRYPLLVLEKTVLFPYSTVPIVVEGESMKRSVEFANSKDQMLAIVFDEKEKFGVLAKILQYWPLSPEVLGASIQITDRIEILEVSSQEGLKTALVKLLQIQPSKKPKDLKNFSHTLFHKFMHLVSIENPAIAENLHQMEHRFDAEKISDIISGAIKTSFENKMLLLKELDLEKRFSLLDKIITSELGSAEAEKKIDEDVQSEMKKIQKDFVLREKLKAIEKQLGNSEEDREYNDLEKKLKTSGMPKEIESKAEKELRRLRRMGGAGPEAPYILTYLEVLSELPWDKLDHTEINLKKAKAILDEDHFGLEKVKERILEFLAVEKLTGGSDRGGILCFIGPPGTGKTSVGKSIARALNRKFIRMSLGGVHDESEIRGHRRTYVGALPGRIIQSLRNAGSRNPVFMIDEIDKVGADFRGDPTSALLEVLDPAQNNTFYDNYLEAPFDLSKIFFITTANIADPIPAPLRDRMEIIEFSGYTPEEKFQIAKRYLVPRVLKRTGLKESELKFDDNAVRQIIQRYTLEAGVRELERRLEQITRKAAYDSVTSKSNTQYYISSRDLEKYLGPEKFRETVREEKDEIGVATGLAWTPTGGQIIFIETQVMPGKRNLTLTGQLGNVMQESAKAALTYIRSQSDRLHFDPKFYQTSDLHIHVPAGGIPKDGPSAGVAIAIALASALTKKPVRKEVALTGEITLSGKVLPVGGIKEKVLAAYRAGVETIVLPDENKTQLPEIPEEIKKTAKIYFVKYADEALKIALR